MAQTTLPHVPEIERYTIEDGLSQTRVNLNFIDSRGFLWIGTTDGLNRYDGYIFNVYRHMPLDSQSISNNYIHAIDEDNKGNLWIATNSGLNRFDPHTDKFSNYNRIWEDSLGINTIIKSVYCANNGIIWVLTDGSLVKMDAEKLNFQVFDYLSNQQESNFPQDANTGIVMDRNNILWFGTDQGLYSFDREKEKFRKYSHDRTNPYSLSNNKVLSVYEDRNGELWAGTAKGLNKFDRLNKRFKSYSLFPDKIDPGRMDGIHSIYEDHEGKFWLAGNEGLFLFDKRSGETRLYNQFLEGNIKKEINYLNSVICDQSNILWLGGLQGLVKMDLKPRKFELYNSSEGSFPKLSGTNISAIFKEEPGYLWIGYWRGGVDKIKLNEGKLIHFSGDDHLRNQNIRSLFKDSRNRIWIGTARGINMILPGENKIKKFEEVFTSAPENILNERSIYAFIEDEDENIWIATDKGLYEVRSDTREIYAFNRISDTHGETLIGRVHAITKDLNDNIWLGTEKGLILYERKLQIFQKIMMEEKYDWLDISPVYALCLGRNGSIWMGTSYGLSMYKPSENEFMHYAEKDGLANSFVYAIEEDLNSNIWVSTNQGLSKFNPLTKKFRNYSRNEGLQAYEFNKGASFVTSDGKMFFGGVSGLNCFDPDEIYDNAIIPDIAITDFLVISPSGIFDIPVGKHTSLVKIRHNQSFTIGFSALDFTNPERNRFQYSLEELEKPGNWMSLGEQHFVTISNLPSGEYVFRVKGSNNDGRWSPAGASLRILVEAPFWKTRLAYIIYFSLLMLLFYLIIQYRTNTLRKTNRILRERENTAKEVAKQKDLLSKRNKNIEDSLKYAHRIQSAMLNTPKIFKKYLPESFILHKPKDIVSGDFYWISQQGEKVYVAAVDCTGHGVPGAFMSVIGFELFRKIVNAQNLKDPGEVLDALNDNFQEIFGIENDISLRDGMDLAFCEIEKKKMRLKYAGAFNPLYLIRDNKLMEVKGDRMSIGADNDPRILNAVEKKFTSHTIDLQESDMIYLFSDGYADQFGGPEGKKFKYRRFRHLLLTVHQLPMEKQKEFLNESIEDWRGEIDQIDDILVIGIKADFYKKKEK
ncbi:MAG: two-component regulator propeller domain-containing protein [Bacteroidota bacterium]